MSKAQPAKNRGLVYRGVDASIVGSTEPTWPTAEDQYIWTPNQRNCALGAAFRWYNITQDAKRANEFVAEWLSQSPKRADLAQIVRKHGNMSPTMGWLCRSAQMGYVLRIRDLRKIQAALTEMVIAKRAEMAEQAKSVAVAPVKKRTIQDHLQEKIYECGGEIQGHFDDFVVGGCQSEPNLLPILIRYNIPQARVRDLTADLEKQLLEFREVQKGADPQLVEGYSQYGKRQITRMVDWCTKALEQLFSYGTMKAAARKPKTRRGQTPQKMVSKLKYLDKDVELKIQSIDPTQILKATELWVYNVKKRKLGIYLADDSQGSLYIKGSKILGYSETRSICKTLRKPDAQLKELMAAGKPASKKWFEDIKAVESKLNGRITEEFLLLKVYK
jgi:hypothetical protein